MRVRLLQLLPHLDTARRLPGLFGRGVRRHSRASELPSSSDLPAWEHDGLVLELPVEPLGRFVGLSQALDDGAVAAGVSMLKRGHLHLGRFRLRLPADGVVSVAVELAGVCWVGPADRLRGDLEPAVHRTEATLDRSGRLYLRRDLRVRLALADPNCFGALVLAAPVGGVLVVPVEGFARRVGVPW